MKSLNEYHLLFTPADRTCSFAGQLASLHAQLHDAVAAHGGLVLMRRYFLSDAANQEPTLDEALQQEPFSAVSVVQQPPLDGSKVALWAYIVAAEGGEELTYENGLFTHNGYRHYWMGHALPPQREPAPWSKRSVPEHQMVQLFEDYDMELRAMDMTVADHCVRTWLFVHDVDVNYGGVVKGRNTYFRRIGLTPRTHFIASTGIQGRTADAAVKVEMDAYAVGGLQPSQIGYLYGKSHLNSTYEYGVAFERGTAVTYGDRRHVFISGTASIDNQGTVLHVGDVCRQTERMLENVGVLLAEAGADFSHVAMAIVYLRDAADYAAVRTLFAQRFPAGSGFGIDRCLFVHAPVCRPTWLIEMECIAVVPVAEPDYQPF